MKKFFLFVLIGKIAFAQINPLPNEVVFYRQGPNATIGFDTTNIFFPQNVLGFPDSLAEGCNPSSIPNEIQSLGDGGEIILHFADIAIVDEDGSDFTIFENAFFIGCDSNLIYREFGIVSVSKDGINYFEFPFDTLTLHNICGVTPTLGGIFTNPNLSGGDKFDLSEIGIDSIHFVKITDAGNRISNDFGNFDLDAVVALNFVPTTNKVKENFENKNQLLSVFPNPFNPKTKIVFSLAETQTVILQIYDINGKKISTLINKNLENGNHEIEFDGSNFQSGIYFLKLSGKNFSLTKKIILTK